MILEILGNNIRNLRKELGWTQEKLAEKAGISVPFMTQIELGHKSASLEVVAKIAEALGVDYSVLFLNGNNNKIKKSMPYFLKTFEKSILDDVKNSISKHIEKLEKNLS